jgi:hypothetical protein
VKQVQEVTLSSHPNRLKLSRLALAALLATGAASAAANVLVVRASGPSAKGYPPGRSLADNAQIQLRAGDSVVVLTPRGTRTFRGPGTFTASASAQTGPQTVQASNGRRARIGAVRNAGIVPTAMPPTIWDVDATQSGTMCLAGSSELKLWRPDANDAATLTITGPSGQAQTVSWAAGADTVAWPAAVPLVNNGEYQLSLSGSPVPARIRVKTLSSRPTDLQAVAEALISNECREQLDLLVDTAPPL